MIPDRAEPSTRAPAEAANTTQGEFCRSDANSKVAIWVLSPSSATKIVRNMVMSCATFRPPLRNRPTLDSPPAERKTDGNVFSCGRREDSYEENAYEKS